MSERRLRSEDVARRWRTLREQRGLSLEQMAQRSGLSVAELGRLEQGADISFRAVAQLAASLDLPVSALFDPPTDAASDPDGFPWSMTTEARGLGAQIRALRESRALSLRELSQLSGVSAPMLSQIERDETVPRLELADRIAGGFGLSLAQLLRSDVVLPQLDLRVKAVSEALITLLGTRPELMYDLRPRQFEELLAELYEREGFVVELTQETRDGGVDLYLVRHTAFGRLLTLVDAKRYRADRSVGVGAVRQLYGVVEAHRASTGVVATTSFFSRAAESFQEQVPFRLGLQDFRDLHAMLRDAAA